jgi:uncharacterized protein
LIVQSFLPKQLTEEQVFEIVSKVTTQLGAASMKDMGKVMKAVMAEIPAGSATNQVVSSAVKKVLSPPKK